MGKLLGKNLCGSVAQTKAWQNWDTKLLSNWLSTDVTKITGIQYRVQHLFRGCWFCVARRKTIVKLGSLKSGGEGLREVGVWWPCKSPPSGVQEQRQKKFWLFCILSE